MNDPLRSQETERLFSFLVNTLIRVYSSAIDSCTYHVDSSWPSETVVGWTFIKTPEIMERSYLRVSHDKEYFLLLLDRIRAQQGRRCIHGLTMSRYSHAVVR